MFALSACNSKEDEPAGGDNYVASASVAITKFYLSPDIKVMRNLDSVFFSIDLEHGVIFNADSLPKGTKITKLVPKITYPSTVKSAIIEMKGGTHREDGTVDYIANPSDTIDFSGQVTITLATADNEISKTYQLKVNVHQEDPDTMFWENTAETSLPSLNANPKAQKTVKKEGGAYTLIQEADNSYTGAYTADIFTGIWEKEALNLGFTPNLPTLSSDAAGTLYILSETGDLYSSSDGSSWNMLDSGWSRIIGPYGACMLGSKGETMVSWPQGVVTELQLPENFPTSGYTYPIELTTRWAPNPTIVIFGGDKPTGAGSPSWAFDGGRWVNLADEALPALNGLSVTRYYAYLNNASNGLLKEFDVLLAFGGKKADNSLNNTVYISYDYGMNWMEAPEYLQLPKGLTTGYMVDALALSTPMESNLSDRWKQVKPSSKFKVNFQIDGDLIKWDCPYIFLFGGYNGNQVLDTNVRSGILRRLTFVPLF